MPFKRKYKEKLDLVVTVRMTEQQSKLMQSIEDQTGMGSADIWRAALLAYAEKIFKFDPNAKTVGVKIEEVKKSDPLFFTPSKGAKDATRHT